MSKYFDYFPEIKYNNQAVLNITLRTKILDELQSDPYAFLPYTVEEGMGPEEVAQYYYGSPEYVWIVFFSNNIIDPLHEWVKNSRQMKNFLDSKYTQNAEDDGFDSGYYWSMSEATSNNILHYVLQSDSDVLISPDTYNYEPSVIQGDYRPVRIFEYEDELNEQKRTITLLNNAYSNIAIKNLKRLLAQ